MIVIIYFRIVKYMKRNPFSNINRSNKAAHHRQKSELRLIRRILILIIILFILGFPYSFFYFTVQLNLLSLWDSMPRISYLFITFGQSASMLINLITTDGVRKCLRNLLNKCSGKKVQTKH